MSEYPKALYRDGTEFEWDGRPTDILHVADVEAEAKASGEGWRLPEDYLGGPPSQGVLDGTAKEIEAALPGLALEQLEALKADEIAGKSRKGVLAALDAEIDRRLA